MSTARAVQQSIRKLEGFRIRLLSKDGIVVPPDRAGFPRYACERAAARSITVKEWIRRRLGDAYADFRVEVTDGEGNAVAPRTLLKTVRTQTPPQRPRKRTSSRNEAELPQLRAAEAKPTSSGASNADSTDLTDEASDQGNSLDGRVIEWPKQIFKRAPTFPIEIDLWELPDAYCDGEHVELIRKLVAQWVKAHAFSGRATLWELLIDSVTFHHAGQSHLIMQCGLPKAFETYLYDQLTARFRAQVRHGDGMLPNESEGWRAVCHVEQGTAWAPVDAAEWNEVLVP